MPLTLSEATTDHRELVRAVAETAGIADPVAVHLDDFRPVVLKAAVRGPFVPIQGVLVRDWDRSAPRTGAGTRFGARLYRLDGLPFARCVTDNYTNVYEHLTDFFVVARADYRRFYRAALRSQRAAAPTDPPPVLPAGLLDTLRQNTLGYLNRDNLRRIRPLGGRPRRGILLSGPPGNGKTSACRWVWQECHRLRYEYRVVTPDMYKAARGADDPDEAVKELFDVSRRGCVFFDDLDVALRDRTLAPGSDDQAVFLGAMDGIEAREGVVYVFTTNCPIDEIDPAFLRPGRIDLVLEFEAPTPGLRRELIERWHPEIKAGIDLDRAVADTAGWSFAEIEEVKNLLILTEAESGRWDWAATLAQYENNRTGLVGGRRRIGFHLNGRAAANGHVA